ncbi:hypothetical protein MBLNU459_g5334t1 [Dothideomycetes sp. NU459]
MAPLTSSAINRSKTVAPKAVARRRPAAPPSKPQAAATAPVVDAEPEESVTAGAAENPALPQVASALPTASVESSNAGPSDQTAPANDTASAPQVPDAEQALPTPPSIQRSEKEPTPQAAVTPPLDREHPAIRNESDIAGPSVLTPASSDLPPNRQPSPYTPSLAENESTTEVVRPRTPEAVRAEEVSAPQNATSAGAERPASPRSETPTGDVMEAPPARMPVSPRVSSPSAIAGVKRKRGAPGAVQPSSNAMETTGEIARAVESSTGAIRVTEELTSVGSGEEQIGAVMAMAAQKPAKPRAKRQKKGTDTTDGQLAEEGTVGATVTPSQSSARAKAKAKPRAKRQPKSAARVVEDENGNIVEEPELPAAKEKPARKPRQRKPKNPEQAAATTEEAEEVDPELHEIDVTVTTMSHLTRDRKVGKTSEREVKMAAIDWPEVIRKRQEAADAIARGAAVESEGGEKANEDAEGTDGGDGAGVRESETPGPRAAISGPRLRLDADGNLVVDETSLRIDRQAQAEANAANLEVTEEDDLTKRVNRMTWLSDRKKDPTERVPFFKMKSDPWTDEETDRFYDALRMFGTDFFIISKMFVPKTRRQIKLKFIREERLDPSRVNRALAGENTAMSLEHFAEATGQEVENFKDPRILEEELRVEGEEQREEIALKKKEIEEAKKQRDVQMAAREKDQAKRDAQKKQKAQARANRRRGVFGTGTF